MFLDEFFLWFLGLLYFDNCHNNSHIIMENDDIESIDYFNGKNQNTQEENLSNTENNTIPIDSGFGNDQSFSEDNSFGTENNISILIESGYDDQLSLSLPKTNNLPIFKIEKIMDRSCISGEISNIGEKNGKKLSKKRGRKNGKDKPQHLKTKNDNKMAKIQRHYFTFLIQLLNLIILKLRKDDHYLFYDIDGDHKGNIKKKNREGLNKKTIEKILYNTPISDKRKNDRRHNKIVLNKLKEEGQTIILNILEQKFLFFFEKVYYTNLKKFDLSSFCEIQSLIGQNLDLEIDLTKNPNVKTFNDLFNKEEIKDLDYENKMHICAEKYFLSQYRKEH